jgi:hypothetical protein
MPEIVLRNLVGTFVAPDGTEVDDGYITFTPIINQGLPIDGSQTVFPSKGKARIINNEIESGKKIAGPCNYSFEVYVRESNYDRSILSFDAYVAGTSGDVTYTSLMAEGLTPINPPPTGNGSGDMLKSVYDPDANGSVVLADHATTATSASTAATATNATNATTATNATNAVNATNATNASVVPWSGITGKPTEFPPSEHAIAKVTNLQQELDARPTLTGGKLSPTVLPALAIGETFEVESQAAMLALTAQKGDVAIRNDLPATFRLAGDDPTILANWKQLKTPTDLVVSVNGQTGIVTITPELIGAALAAHDHDGRYYTQAEIDELLDNLDIEQDANEVEISRRLLALYRGNGQEEVFGTAARSVGMNELIYMIAVWEATFSDDPIVDMSLHPRVELREPGKPTPVVGNTIRGVQPGSSMLLLDVTNFSHPNPVAELKRLRRLLDELPSEFVGVIHSGGANVYTYSPFLCGLYGAGIKWYTIKDASWSGLTGNWAHAGALNLSNELSDVASHGPENAPTGFGHDTQRTTVVYDIPFIAHPGFYKWLYLGLGDSWYPLATRCSASIVYSHLPENWAPDVPHMGRSVTGRTGYTAFHDFFDFTIDPLKFSKTGTVVFERASMGIRLTGNASFTTTEAISAERDPAGGSVFRFDGVFPVDHRPNDPRAIGNDFAGKLTVGLVPMSAPANAGIAHMVIGLQFDLTAATADAYGTGTPFAGREGILRTIVNGAISESNAGVCHRSTDYCVQYRSGAENNLAVEIQGGLTYGRIGGETFSRLTANDAINVATQYRWCVVNEGGESIVGRALRAWDGEAIAENTTAPPPPTDQLYSTWQGENGTNAHTFAIDTGQSPSVITGDNTQYTLHNNALRLSIANPTNRDFIAYPCSSANGLSKVYIRPTAAGSSVIAGVAFNCVNLNQNWYATIFNNTLYVICYDFGFDIRVNGIAIPALPDTGISIFEVEHINNVIKCYLTPAGGARTLLDTYTDPGTRKFASSVNHGAYKGTNADFPYFGFTPSA